MAVSSWGWTTGSIGVAGAGLCVVVLTLFTVRDYPGKGTLIERLRGTRGRLSVRAEALQKPETTPLAVATLNTNALNVVEQGNILGRILRRLSGLVRLP